MQNILIWGITKGIGSGIGFKLGEYLALRNFSVYGVIRDSKKELPKGCKEVLVSPQKNEYLKFLETHSIQTVISCVGVGYVDNFITISSDKINEMINANFITNINALQWSLQYLVEITEGKIIILGTIAAVTPEQGSSVYSGTKAGMRALVTSLRHELLPVKLPISMLHFNSVQDKGIIDVCEAIEYQLYSKIGSEVILY